MKPETQQFCTFKVNDWSFGVDVRDVQEVIRDQVMTNVPLASDVICGLMNLRGQVVTVLDLRRRFELNDSSLDRSPMNVVIRIDREFISLLVEEIGEVVKVPDEAIEPPPSTIDKKVRRFISGVYRFDNHMLQILDLEKIINLSHNQKNVSVKFREFSVENLKCTIQCPYEAGESSNVITCCDDMVFE